MSPAMAGLKKGSMANLRSRIRRGLKIAGISVHGGKRTNPLTPEWLATAEALGYGPRWWALSAFAHFASERNWKQGEIGSAHMDTFRDALMSGSVHNAPQNAFYQTVKAWNQCAATIQGWPGKPISQQSSRPPPYVMSEEEFPETLRQQIRDHFDQLVNPSPFSATQASSGPSPFAAPRRRGIAAETAKTQAYQLWQYLSALVAKGMRPQEMTCLTAVLTVELVERGLTFFYERAGNRMAPQIEHIGWVLVGVAKHFLKNPSLAGDIRAMLRETRRRHEMSSKVKGLLRQFDDPRNRKALLDLPTRLVRLARSAQSKTPTEAARAKAARLFEAALAIELQINCPLRVGNLAALDIGKHFMRSRPGPKGVIHLVIPAEEVKNRRPLEFELPMHLARLFEEHIATYRPYIPGSQSRWLFPDEGGTHVSSRLLSARLSNFILRYTGLRMTVHMFRHFAAEMLLEAMPNGHEVVRMLLGHTSAETAHLYYIRRNMSKAVKLFSDHILKARQERCLRTSPGRRRSVRRG